MRQEKSKKQTNRGITSYMMTKYYYGNFPGLNSGERAFIGALIAHWQPGSPPNPGVNTIARMMGITPRHAKKIKANLVRKGVIKISNSKSACGRKHNASIYHLDEKKALEWYRANAQGKRVYDGGSVIEDTSVITEHTILDPHAEQDKVGGSVPEDTRVVSCRTPEEPIEELYSNTTTSSNNTKGESETLPNTSTPKGKHSHSPLEATSAPNANKCVDCKEYAADVDTCLESCCIPSYLDRCPKGKWEHEGQEIEVEDAVPF